MDKGMCIFALKTRFYKEYGDQLKLQGVKDGDPITIASPSGALDKVPLNTLEQIAALLENQKPDVEVKSISKS